MKITVRMADGSKRVVTYKRTSDDEKRKALSRYFVEHHGWRPSEAAMTVTQYGEDKLLRMYKNLVILNAIKQP